ncbi:MAG TPA: hypothetical protein VGD58_17585 [Herpetosiphonaceae bacterium]
MIYVYGPLDEFQHVLTARGLTEGQIEFLAPHSHHYHAEFDDDERQVMEYWEWMHFPLQEDDE